MPKDIQIDATVHITDGQPTMLPGNDVIADAQFARDGSDLLLTNADGYTVKVEGYFDHNPPPALDTPDGKHLSPDMVSAFLPPAHAAQYADATHGAVASDESPVGKITQVIGKAEIIHADGTHTAATLNSAIHQGDVIQTADKGGVNILFVDNTTFAIGENARMSVDQFTYNATEHSGSTFFSMLQGMFVYTSGLIGKHDPGHVNIDTPVGSIGIRGTVVAGDIHPTGQDSHITIVDGAIVVTNDGGSLMLNNTFDTAVLNSYGSQPTDAGQMTAQGFTSTYDSVHGVATGTFDSVSNGTYHTDTPTTTTPDTGPTHGFLQLPGDVINSTAVAEAPSGSSFGGDGSGSSFSGASTASTTTAALASTTTTSTTAAHIDTTAAGSGVTQVATAPTSHLGFSFESWYVQDGNTVPLLYLPEPNLAAAPDPSFLLGHINATGFDVGTTFDIISPTLSTPVYTYAYSPTVAAGSATVDAFTLTGNSVNITDPYAMISAYNGTDITFTIEARDAGGAVIDSQVVHVGLDSALVPSGGFHTIQIGDNPASVLEINTGVPVATADSLIGQTAGLNDLLYGRDGNDTLTSFGGYDTLLGGNGDDTIILSYDNKYQFIDGGSGNNTLQLGNASSTSLNFDFTAKHNVYNVDLVKLDSNHANSLTLDFKDIFDMVGNNGTLTISTDSGGANQSVTLVNDSDGGSYSTSGSLGVGNSTYTIHGAYNGNSVTLVIEQGDAGHGNIAATVT